MDLIHKALKTLDHNRGTTSGIAVLVASLFLGSCGSFDGRVVSSTSGEQLDQDGLRAEYIQESNQLQARYDAARLMVLEGQAAIEQIERDAEKLGASYEQDAQLAAVEVEQRASWIGELGGIVATAAGIPWLLPLVSLGTTATATGAVYDNRRKDKIIRKKSTATS